MKQFTSQGRKIASGCLLAAALWSASPSLQAIAQQAGNSQEQRIQQIEDQLLDIQGIIGTLQSLTRNPAASQPVPGSEAMVPPDVSSAVPGAASGELTQRVDVIETQIRALSGQMEQISAQLSQIQASLGTGGNTGQAGVPGQPYPQGQKPQGFSQQGQAQPSLVPGVQPQQQAGFGTLSVQPRSPVPGQIAPQANPGQASQDQGQGQPAAPGQLPRQGQFFGPGPGPQAAATPAPENPDTRAAYEAAYSQMLQRDFASAESGFSAFLASYPQDPLAGNAQYWLGETYYVRGKYRQAADSFLKGYRKYRGSDKAPANLLKLGMSLHQLGQKDAACATFAELTEKFPRAPQHLKQRAASERQRSGC